jgi:hypothetical protein
MVVGADDRTLEKRPYALDGVAEPDTTPWLSISASWEDTVAL